MELEPLQKRWNKLNRIIKHKQDWIDDFTKDIDNIRSKMVTLSNIAEENGFVLNVEKGEWTPKTEWLYLCNEDIICLTHAPCSQGRELKRFPSMIQGIIERYDGGFTRKFEPSGVKIFFKFKDGTEETRYDQLTKFVEGCDEHNNGLCG